MIDDWKRYGEDKFEFKIVEVLYDKDKLLSREEFWIKETFCNRVACYNKIIDVGKRSRCYIRIDVSYFSEIRFLINRNAHAATVLMLFIEHMDDENNVSCTYDFMGRYFSCSRATLHRSIKFLTDEEYISISKIGNCNLYTINRQMFSTISLRKCA